MFKRVNEVHRILLLLIRHSGTERKEFPGEDQQADFGIVEISFKTIHKFQVDGGH